MQFDTDTVRATFRAILDAAETLLPDCETATEAARIASENHGYPDPGAVDCVAICLIYPDTDADFWAGEWLTQCAFSAARMVAGR